MYQKQVKLREYIAANGTNTTIFDERRAKKGFCVFDEDGTSLCKSTLTDLKQELCAPGSDRRNDTVCGEVWEAWTPIPLSSRTVSLLNFNLVAGMIHLIQAIIMVIFGTRLEFNKDILGYFYNYENVPVDPPFLDPQTLFTITNLGAFVSIFLFMSAFAHFIIALPLKYHYADHLSHARNPFRWWEYGFSSSVMIVLIAMFFNVNDLFTLLCLFTLTFFMNMMGLVMEQINANKPQVKWFTYNLGVVAGLVPWIVITGYFIGTIMLGGEPPAFVYAIFFVELVLYSSFAFVMVAHYKKIGNFVDYAFSERAYVILSLVAKTALAWIVFGGVFQPN